MASTNDTVLEREYTTNAKDFGIVKCWLRLMKRIGAMNEQHIKLYNRLDYSKYRHYNDAEKAQIIKLFEILRRKIFRELTYVDALRVERKKSNIYVPKGWYL